MSSNRSIQNWIGAIINFSKKELANRFTFTELFILNNKNFNEKISDYVKKIGIPLVLNQKDECISLLPEGFDQNDFIQLYAANKFIDYVNSDTKPCQMLPFCNSNRKSIVNSQCTDEPILRASCKELCPFGAFVKSYGLHDIDWKVP